MSAVVAGASPEARRRRGRERADEESVRVKVESDADIKDYAETTMNELLGWYGYDKLDTRGLNLKHLNQNFPTSSSSSSPMRHDEDFSEDDTGLSRSPQPDSESVTSNTNGGTIVCAWCLKTGLKLFTLKSSSGKTKAFCSEPCFNQCRRAAFKKNRVCNWCRHVRHTVNYVDFKDGDEQLQFCSDKCLNQYKMQIFCKETQAYLQMNPHLQEESNKHAGTTNSKLITPDLWLRDCQESMNGGTAPNVSHSEDESSPSNIRSMVPKPSNGLEVEDLTLASKGDRCSSSCTNISVKDRSTPLESRRNLDDSPVGKDKHSLEMFNALASYLRDDRDKNNFDRRKRHQENEKDHFRKKQKMSSIRHRSSHPAEAPPAHLSSTAHSPLTLQNQNRLFQPSSCPPSLSNNSPVPPAAHTKSLPPHPALAGPLLPPGLPPPPPLLNNEFLHSPFTSSFFQPSLSPQQHLDAVLRMQSGMRPGEHFPPHLFQESMYPFLRNAATQQSPNSFLQPNTMMLPYPIFVPLPVPIPVPIPLSSSITKDKKQSTKDVSHRSVHEDLDQGDNSDSLNVDSEPESKKDSNSMKSNYSENESNDVISEHSPKKERHSSPAERSSYAVVNNDSHSNRLILTRNKPR
ncbi:sine oculis-binding protein homolog [Trichonephila inaurata madagascariensis]|uniref:Sine oculis-binding protein homolog n=1 Tax=Trichonephila inaurata madagascariensis TaxID=2747483 RepID=A0A8X6YPV5_9ARAC|nr:sine oculis-binding protein homolog [Trichonephila inaurata madagascariensis]